MDNLIDPPPQAPALLKKCRCARQFEGPQKTCPKCREARRSYTKRYAEKLKLKSAITRLEQPAMGSSAGPAFKVVPGSEAGPSQWKKSMQSTMETPKGSALKFKPYQKHDPSQWKKSTQLDGKMPRDPVSAALEYQTARELYDSLRIESGLLSSKLQFEGCYSIIAAPKIDLSKRAAIAVADITKVCNQLVGPARQGVKSPAGQAIHDCSCQAKSGKNACGGQIQVVVVEDTTHPVLSGQKVFVKVHHPTEPANT